MFRYGLHSADWDDEISSRCPFEARGPKGNPDGSHAAATWVSEQTPDPLTLN